MGSAGQRFTDRDIREDPGLVALAIQYADQYRGEFEFMLDARELVLSTGSLPAGVARGVLNCMRLDPRAAPVLQSHQYDDRIDHSHLPRRPTLTVVRDQKPERRHRIETACRLKPGLAVGVARNGSVLHAVRDYRMVWEDPPRYQRKPGWTRKPVLEVGWVCGSSYATTRWPRLFADDGGEANEWPLCASGCWLDEQGAN